MLDILQKFADGLSLIFDFLTSFFRNIVEIVQMAVKGFGYITAVLGFMPLQYQVALLAVVSFSFIVTILHFGGQ